MRAEAIRQVAAECGFELAGVAPAGPIPDADVFLEWAASGMAGSMNYLTDHRAELRRDPRSLLDSAQSVVCVAKIYKQPEPTPHIAQYAVAEDYHGAMKTGLETMAQRLQNVYGAFEYRTFVDTGPLLERSLARLAGLGWIGKNTCLINQELGSWLFLGEMLTSIPLEPGVPAAERCGTCTRCIDACPTDALVPGGNRTLLDATRCISYYTIEHRGEIPAEWRGSLGEWVFGCDICQDVCPWNRRAPETRDPLFTSALTGAELEELALMSPEEFRSRFRKTPVWRTKYSGFLRNVAVAMGNTADPRYRPVLEKLAVSEDALIASHAQWALDQLKDEVACV